MSCRNCTYFTRICFGFQRFPYRDKESNVLGLTWILSSSRAGELLEHPFCHKCKRVTGCAKRGLDGG